MGGGRRRGLCVKGAVPFMGAELFSVPDVIFPLAKIDHLDFYEKSWIFLYLEVRTFSWAQLGEVGRTLLYQVFPWVS